ncbi:MAG: YihY/virulence factor BrkB family protein [Nitriliruptorales bacterium]|nr:YihY/virulence factor BrkB family protein [Nitriliruptorales bacterium]
MADTRHESDVRYDTDERAAERHHEQHGKSERDLPGADAERPRDMGWSAWKQVLTRVKDEIREDNVALLAGGVALFALLAVPPAIVAAVTLWGLFAEPSQITQAISSVSEILPGGATTFLEDQITSVAEGSDSTLGWGLAIGLVAAIWSASSGMKGIMNALTGAYDETEGRGFLKLRGMALALTFGGMIFALLTIGLIAVLPVVLEQIAVISWIETVFLWGRWPALALAMVLGLAALYHYGPDRSRAKWRWVTPGAIAGTLIWLAASAGFAWYASAFDKFSSTYGTMAGLVIFILWLFLTAFSILIGAEINAELEHQTAADSTVDGPSPMGQRGAYVADTRPEQDSDER